jgi:PmbA protein
LRCEAAAREADERIVNFDRGGLETIEASVALANSIGFAGSYRATSISLMAVPVAKSGEQMQRDYWYDVRRFLGELESPESIGREAAARALRKLGARKIPTCDVPVVFDPRISRDLLNLVAQAVSGESIFRRASFLGDRLEERVASENVTIVDDGRVPRALGSRPFDGEGLATRRTVVAREGVLDSYLLNTYTGRKLGMASTANAARGLVGPVGVAPGNLFVEPGSATQGEILESVKRGLFVTELMGHGVNIVNGDYSRGAAGLWIENGEPTYPVEEVTIAGNLREMLLGIEAIGSDLDFRGRVAAPTLLIGRMAVSGT